jgi:hypothetical protein
VLEHGVNLGRACFKRVYKRAVAGVGWLQALVVAGGASCMVLQQQTMQKRGLLRPHSSNNTLNNEVMQGLAKLANYYI